MDRWAGKTAVVTGASSGIGAAISVELANAGVNVVGLARRTQPIEVTLYCYVMKSSHRHSEFFIKKTE